MVEKSVEIDTRAGCVTAISDKACCVENDRTGQDGMGMRDQEPLTNDVRNADSFVQGDRGSFLFDITCDMRWVRLLSCDRVRSEIY